ncbi:hypothetical protein ACFPM3_11910 [Streptomyces coeruleoprunus]|uniref:Secreted protein n=1 Tax=Streptomyces coeruleoprunus TaxID=285563 RepID=A0ABV9XF23_9ACTN
MDGRRRVAGLAVLCAAVSVAAAAPVAGSVRIEGAVAGPTGRTASVTYTYRCEPELQAVLFAVRLHDRTSGVLSRATHVREPQVCDGVWHTRTDAVAVDDPAFRRGDAVVARVLMAGAGDGRTTTSPAAAPARVSASRAMTLD